VFQILHIFRKDGRRHWPEILASLVLLGAYAHQVLHPWPRGPRAISIGRFFWMIELIPPALILFWFFLILRIVQGETLVGDRQWWVSKPYIWWKLFLSKCLFVFAVVSFPLFLVQLYLLFINGFPVFANFLTVLRLQAGLAVMLFLSAFSLGALTRNLAQAILTIVGLFVVLYAAMSIFLDSGSSSPMSGPGFVPDSIQSGLRLLFAVGLLLWQYAFRKTWQSRGLLCLGVAFVALLASLPGDKNYVEKTYPLVRQGQAPARIELNFRSPEQKEANLEGWSELLPEVNLRIPLKTSGLAPGSMLMVRGMKLTLTRSDGAVWTQGWRYAYAQAWPEDEVMNDLAYGMKRQDFQTWKNATVRVQIELAMSHYAEDQPREVVLQPGVFSDSQLGTCRINPDRPSELGCLKPFHGPAYMATFDGREFPCGSEEDSQAVLWHAWSDPYVPDLIEVGLSPITSHSIDFREPKPNSIPYRQHRLRFCEGAKIKFAYPKLREDLRIQLEIPSISVKALSMGLFSLNDIPIETPQK
jgi:hypothetical protein